MYIRKGTPIEPIIFGGTQEGNIRPGTENVPGIVGLGAAMDLRNREYQQRFEALENFRNYLIGSLHKNFPDVKINGSHTDQAPHVISISFPGADGELLLYHLDQAGISVSMGSACTSEEIEPSHVLTAMKLPIFHIEGTLRISLGIQTSREEIDQLVMELVKVIEKSRF